MHTQATVKVWDPAVRIFHWSLAAAFFLAYVTEDDLMGLHVFAGYAALGLVLFRLIWGFIGTEHARFSDFVYRPALVLAYLKDVVSLHARRYLGHNPAAGVMVLALLASVLVTCVTGLVVYGAGEEQAGPLAGWFAGGGEFWGEVFEEVHEFFANFTVLLVFVHVAGVIASSLLHRENLVKAMFTGRKRAKTGI